MKQFHPKYAAPEELDKQAKADGLENWVLRFKFKIDWSLNTELPVLTPGARPRRSASRPGARAQPLLLGGRQRRQSAPYIDKIQLTLAENLEVLNLRAMAGDFDVQGRHESITKLVVLLDNQQKGTTRSASTPATTGPT